MRVCLSCVRWRAYSAQRAEAYASLCAPFKWGLRIWIWVFLTFGSKGHSFARKENGHSSRLRRISAVQQVETTAISGKEKRFDDIIPDIVVYSGDKYFFIEIYVTHPIDDEKLKKLKEKKISTIEIDLSKEKRDISVEELSDILLKSSDRKSWKYNAVSEKWYRHFEKASDKMPLTQRGLALHVDGCPIGIRNWKGKNYANFVDDCTGCEYCISYAHEGYILCSGRERIATKKDFLISKEERISNSNNPLPKIEKCPNCKVQLVRAKKDKGDVWQCPRCTFYIPVGFNSDEN